MEIVHYPHPTLRHKSKPLKKVDGSIKSMIKQMFELMYEAKGIGLAANQVDLPFQMFIVNLVADPEEGEELVFINPVISKPKGSEEGEEGCLSLPGLYGQVIRPKKVHVKAYNHRGELFDEDVDGLLARVIQHETDHLNGIMFIDRLSESGKLDLQDEVDEFVTEFESRQRQGGFPEEAEIKARLASLEADYC